MTPVIATTKKRDFDPTKFLTTIGEGRKIVPVGKKQTIYAQGAACDAVFYIQKGKVGLTVVAKRQGSYDRHIESWRFLRRRWPCRAAFAHGDCNRDDRLRTHANREKGNDGRAPRTYIVRHVYGVFVGAEHPIRSGLG
jgi:hypothetical protein